MIKILNKAQSNFSSHIPLYHSTYQEVPHELGNDVHNTKPSNIYKNLKWMKNNFNVVTLDEMFEEPSKGKVAVTFDDAYNSVLEEAFPVLEDLQIPATIFINGRSFDTKCIWRHKVRFLISNNLVEEFLDANESYKPLLNRNNFYLVSKSPDVSSLQIDQAISLFLERKKIDIDDFSYILREPKQLINHTLLTYGNHGYNHYLLSSLTESQQEDEILRNKEFLKSLSVPTSKIFAVPFGRENDFTSRTIQILKNLEYTGFLYSRNSINLSDKGNYQQKAYSLPGMDRYMSQDSTLSFQLHIFRLGLKAVLTKLFGARRKDVLFVGDDYGVPAGWSEVCKNLFFGLEKALLARSIAFFSFRKVLSDPTIKFFGNLFTDNGTFKFLFLFMNLLSSLFILNFRKINVIHCLAEPYIPLSYLLARIYKCRLVITIYGTYSVTPFFSNFKNIYSKAFSYAYRISSISSYSADKFINLWGYKDKIDIVHLGGNKETFKPNLESTKEPFFMFVGTMKERKGLLPSLQAFVKFNRSHPGYKFYVVSDKGFGASSKSSYLKEVIEIIEKYPDEIVLTGKLSEKELIKLYQKTTANILVSISNELVFEGFGLIHVEANLCGSLTIGGKDSPNEEIIKEGVNGYLADGHNVNSIYEALIKSSQRVKEQDNKELTKICRKSGERFTWDDYVNWSSRNYFI